MSGLECGKSKSVNYEFALSLMLIITKTVNFIRTEIIKQDENPTNVLKQTME